jgi:hypothetical protein
VITSIRLNLVVAVVLRISAGVWGGVDVAAPEAKLEPIRTVEIGNNRELRVNGKPFFPLGSWAQATHRFELLRGLGFNTFVGGRANEYCAAAEKAGGYTITHFNDSMAGHPALLAWMHGDEPDLGIDKGKPRKPAQEVVTSYKRIREADATRPVFLNLTSGFMERGRALPAERKEYYELVVKGSDILSFDYYPIYGWNRPDRLLWVADGVSQLRELGGAKRPVFEFIETSKGSQWVDYEKQIAVLPMHTRAEVWMAIIRGATGIMYFTHAWRPKFNEFEPTEEMRAELKRLNGQITRLAPVILADEAKEKVSISFADGLAGEVMAWSYKGSLYLFANNLDLKWRGGKATIRVEGLKRGAKIEAVDEGRELVADDGGFAEEFAPLGVHLYRIGK